MTLPDCAAFTKVVPARVPKRSYASDVASACVDESWSLVTRSARPVCMSFPSSLYVAAAFFIAASICVES